MSWKPPKNKPSPSFYFLLFSLAFLPVVTSGYWSHDLCDASCSFTKYFYFNTTKQPFWIFSKIGVIVYNLNLLNFMVNENPARVLRFNNLAYGGTFTSLIIKILPWMCKFAGFFYGNFCPCDAWMSPLRSLLFVCDSPAELEPMCHSGKFSTTSHCIAMALICTPPSAPHSPCALSRPPALSPGPPSPPQQSLSLQRASNSRFKNRAGEFWHLSNEDLIWVP